MDAMMSSGTAWDSQYANMTVNEGSELKAPECAEAFVLLMTTILGKQLCLPIFEFLNYFLAERYRNIRSVERQVRFSALQVQLLCDYRERLVQVRDPHPPLSGTYAAVLNAIHYVLQLLHKWAEDPVRIENFCCQCIDCFLLFSSLLNCITGNVTTRKHGLHHLRKRYCGYGPTFTFLAMLVLSSRLVQEKTMI
jgi:hypothetical protein